MSDPARLVAEIEGRGRQERTPCGDGTMLWHIWGDGPALVLLHGGYGSWTHWLRNVESLAQNFRVLAADLPGLGESDPPPKPYTADSIGAIVATGIEALLEPGEAAHIAGFSFGGLIGGHTAERLGARAASLVLVGAGGLGVPRKHPVELINWQDLDGPAAQRDGHRENLARLMLADRANIDDLAIHLQIGNATRARTKSRPLSRIPSLRAALPNIGARLAGIWGERDITSDGTLEQHRLLLQSVQPEAPFVVIPGAGHWVQYEAPKKFDTALLDILS